MGASDKIAVTIGDPSGVGPEIIRAWALGNPDMHSRAAVIAHKTFLDSLPDTIEKVCVDSSAFAAVPGKPSNEGPVMAFAGEKFLMSLVTWHEPLRSVYSFVDEKRIKRAVAAADTLARKIRGIEKPRIAVCGLNPHAGEEGLLGAEEKYIIDPILDSLRGKYPNLSRSLPPDTVFARTLRGEFDCIVAMYHDQGLAPLKAVEFDEAVNVSMNLKFIRTSPDHGTGFSIAGKGIASHKSFENAVKLAVRLSE